MLILPPILQVILAEIAQFTRMSKTAYTILNSVLGGGRYG